MSAARPEQGKWRSWLVLLPIGYALAVTVEFGLRYGYRWSESDSAAFAGFVRTMIGQGTITPTNVPVYPHGFGYQSIASTLVLVTGLDVSSVLLIVLPFMTVVAALIAFVTFRRLTGSVGIAAIAAFLLFLQPEFVFVMERGNHEKVTNTLVLTLVFLLVASLQQARKISAVVPYIVAFYLCAWAAITINAFFASSFLASLILSLALGLLALLFMPRRSDNSDANTLRRLTYPVLSCFALLFIFISYLYAPARYNFGIFHTLIQQISLLFFSLEPKAAPYTTIDTGWVSPWVYLTLTAFNWTILTTAALTWVWLAIHFIRKGVQRAQRGLFLLWLLAAAFAIEVAGSVGIDFSGFLGNNLQVRLFPLFMLFGIPLTVVGAAHWLPRLPGRRWRRPGVAVLVIVLAMFAGTSVLKATNDPLLSNKWLFYTPSEESAVVWTQQQLVRTSIWVGFDERLSTMAEIHLPPSSSGNQLSIGTPNDATRYLLVSDVERERSVRLGIPLPDTRDDDQIFDDGGARIFHRVPGTPYQP